MSLFFRDIFNSELTPQEDSSSSWYTISMKSPEYVVHGTASQKDAERIREEGFTVEEGRATVSGNLLYSFEWATEEERRTGSKSKSEIEDQESGRIIVMKVPEDKAVDYATHTDIEVDEENKVIGGFTSKYVSGRRQLAVFEGSEPHERRTELEEVKAIGGTVPEVTVAKEQIQLSIIPTEKIGSKLLEIRDRLRRLELVDVASLTAELAELISADERNYISPNTDIDEVIENLLRTTIESEVVNMIRNLSLDVERALGYQVKNKDTVKEKEVDIGQLLAKLERIQEQITDEHFDFGTEHLNRYVRKNIDMFIAKLSQSEVTN